MVAFILPANSASSGDFITNSLRLNDDDVPRLARTPSTAGNRRTFSISFWQKKGNTDHDNDQIIFVSGNDDATNFEVSNHTTQAFQIGLHSVNLIRTNRLFRDPSAWTHFFFFIDTTNATESNRFQLYINGVQETSFSQTNIPSQNADVGLGRDVATTFFAQNNANSIDAYISDFHYIDGIKKAPTDFGETNSNGVWVPIEYEGNYGDQGIHLEFKETGTSANASGIGADTSGNGNHLTPTNLAATDITTDTPMNNFATFNSVFPDYATGSLAIVLSEGNCKAVYTGGGSGGNGMKRSSIAVANGKWYAEFKITATNAASDDDFGIGVVPVDNYETGRVAGDHTGGVVYKHTGQKRTDAGGNADYGDSFDDGDIIGVALDMDNGQVFFYKNGTIQNSGTAAATSFSGSYVMMAQANDTANHDHTVEVNFGNPSFSISSGNTDGLHGNFEFAVPSGYFALCTKNLAEYG